MTASEERWDVVGVGANSVDFVNLLPGYPQPFGSFAKMQIKDRRVLCGGQTATAMCTCASLGLRSKYVGVSGTDENGRRIRAELTKRDVDITDLIIRDAENQFAVILVDETTGERIVLWDRDDKLRLRERELPIEALTTARVVHVDDVDDDAAIRAAGIARAAGALVTSDMDRLTPRTEELAASVTHAIFAEHVPTHLAGTNDMEGALRTCAAGSTTSSSSPWASAARWRSKATASITSRRSRCTRSTPPAPATSSAAASSTRWSTASRSLRHCGPRTPPPRSAARGSARSTACRRSTKSASSSPPTSTGNPMASVWLAALVTWLLAWAAPAAAPDRYARGFVAAAPGEAVAVVVAGCARCDWGEAGREGAALRLLVDGKYSQHIMLARGEAAAEYRVSLGTLAAGATG
jgi:hypothetical protein